MLFNSIDFALFLPLAFFLYWFAAKENLKLQNVILLVSSYFFYACWDWRFLFLLVFSTLIDYSTGIKIHEASDIRARKIWLWISIGINLGFLGIFKYYNFFADSFSEALLLLGLKVNPGSINVILPVGISFYTFHGLSYVFDIYNKKIIPERNFISYSVFVSFFPLLVAGPIERATHLLPQIIKDRRFDYQKAVDGLRQILWGLFKKIVIADNCAEYANTIFSSPGDYSGSTLLLGAFFFSIQIYCDFSGYSDIALGTARLFGLELLRNFAFPYFSRDIAEFWRRWHISLSSWFRDYLYIPLGGSRGGTWKTIRNTLIIFVVSGFWHGANWTFIIWGLLNALFILPYVIFHTNRNNIITVAQGKIFPSPREFFSIMATFMLTTLAWIFFRSVNVTQALNILSEIFSGSLFVFPAFTGGRKVEIMLLITIFIAVEWIGREHQFALEKLGLGWNKFLRWSMYYSIVIAIIYFAGIEKQFIYFQF
jgi:alginate O-acetyltransferase complex protein AlgI